MEESIEAKTGTRGEEDKGPTWTNGDSHHSQLRKTGQTKGVYFEIVSLS